MLRGDDQSVWWLSCGIGRGTMDKEGGEWREGSKNTDNKSMHAGGKFKHEPSISAVSQIASTQGP